jgi:hypothetical protein
MTSTTDDIALLYFRHDPLLSEVETAPDVEELLCSGAMVEVHQERKILSTAVGAGRSLEIIKLGSQPLSGFSGLGALLRLVGVGANVVFVTLDTHRLRTARLAPVERNI